MPARRLYIDWLRGVAVAIMIEAHTVDAWVAGPSRTQPLFYHLQFLAGWAAPLFLLLAGVSVSLSAEAKQRRTNDVRVTRRALVRRGWQIFGLALLFRLQAFTFSPGMDWRGVFKPDILNVMGLAMVGSALLWSRGTSRVTRALWWGVPAALAVIAAPLAVEWAWPASLPARLEAYVRINGAGTFTLFPWAGFVFLGGWLGEMLSTRPLASSERRLHLTLALAGLFITALAYVGSFFPSPFAASSFWTTSLSWFLMRFGGMLALLAVAWAWMERPGSAHWSPMLVFGRTSLFVYWVHVELVYGFPTYPLRGALSIPVWLVAYVAFTAANLGLAILWTQRSKAPWVPEWLRVAAN